MDHKAFYADAMISVSSSVKLLGIIVDATIHCFEWADLIDLWEERDFRFINLLESAGYRLEGELDES